MHTLSWLFLVGVLASGTPAPAPTPSTPPAPARKGAPLPAPRFEGLPGWLGFATVKPDAEKPRYYWSPGHPDAQVALFTEDWKEVSAGTKVTLLTPEGARPGTYQDTAVRPYGCDGTQTLAGLRTDARLPEGPVWVLPEGAAAASVLPVSEVPAKSLGVALPKKGSGKDSRAFEAGGMGFLLTKTGKLKGKLTVVLGGKAVASQALEKGDMEGSEKTPMNLYDAKEVGVPVPLAAFQFGEAGPTVVVLSRTSYEGQGFLLAVRRGDKAQLLEDGESLYYCAF